MGCSFFFFKEKQKEKNQNSWDSTSKEKAAWSWSRTGYHQELPWDSNTSIIFNLCQVECFISPYHVHSNRNNNNKHMSKGFKKIYQDGINSRILTLVTAPLPSITQCWQVLAEASHYPEDAKIPYKGYWHRWERQQHGKSTQYWSKMWLLIKANDFICNPLKCWMLLMCGWDYIQLHWMILIHYLVQYISPPPPPE